MTTGLIELQITMKLLKLQKTAELPRAEEKNRTVRAANNNRTVITELWDVRILLLLTLSHYNYGVSTASGRDFDINTMFSPQR